MKLLAKLLAVILVLCILLTLFAACKKQTETPDDGEEEENGQSQSGGPSGPATSDIDDNTELEGEDHNITDDTTDAGQFD